MEIIQHWMRLQTAIVSEDTTLFVVVLCHFEDALTFFCFILWFLVVKIQIFIYYSAAGCSDISFLCECVCGCF